VKKPASGFFTELERLGIEAPKDVVIDRADVHARKQAEYRASAKRRIRDPIHPAPA
jgi:sRNA-binding carbon storage regulator CsrA